MCLHFSEEEKQTNRVIKSKDILKEIIHIACQYKLYMKTGKNFKAHLKTMDTQKQNTELRKFKERK